MDDELNPEVMNLPEYETVDLKGYILGNKAYDIIKGVVTLFLPGFGTLYYSLAEIWDFGAGEQVLASCSALAIFFGLFLKLADKSYNNSDLKYDGNMVVSKQDDKTMYTFEALAPVETFANKAELKFRVK